jgi:hypothetical protein
MARVCSTNGAKRNAYRILVRNPERNIPLGISRRSWTDNIKMNLRETSWDDMDWTDLAEDKERWRALVNTVMNIWIP